MVSDPPITQLLRRVASGDASARGELMSAVYPELRRVAHRELRRERGGHSLQSSALVNEVYLRLAAEREPGFENRAHFMAACAQTMRRILVDYARARRREKRGGGVEPLRLLDDVDLASRFEPDLVALDDALNELARQAPLHARVVELRFFAGLSVDETAATLKISKATANRYWALARAWLLRELSRT